MADVAALERRIEELESRLACFESNTGFMNAETMVEKARAWIARNPKAWKYLEIMARNAIARQERFNIKKELEELREADFVLSAEADYKISNSFSSVFVRMLIQEMPELRELVTLRHSKVDRLFR